MDFSIIMIIIVLALSLMIVSVSDNNSKNTTSKNNNDSGVKSTSYQSHKQYNPYTKYGRRKAREQAERNISNYTPEEKRKHDNTMLGCNALLVIIFIAIALIILVVSGPEAMIKWLK
ncbi:hypothetical protein D0T49_04300 [Paludibacter sp. 221]|uniref:hypothetical protein n=1 Tax=Paludibacter sp. 221 TaxID=2302939 RepID=UPI0013D44C72|nr:hypothetical protein [Paludibacter sp. 221]NDV46261.1 hypothetical protein [Paludibacter sp. 221]